MQRDPGPSLPIPVAETIPGVSSRAGAEAEMQIVGRL